MMFQGDLRKKCFFRLVKLIEQIVERMILRKVTKIIKDNDSIGMCRLSLKSCKFPVLECSKFEANVYVE